VEFGSRLRLVLEQIQRMGDVPLPDSILMGWKSRSRKKKRTDFYIPHTTPFTKENHYINCKKPKSSSHPNALETVYILLFLHSKKCNTTLIKQCTSDHHVITSVPIYLPCTHKMMSFCLDKMAAERTTRAARSRAESSQTSDWASRTLGLCLERGRQSKLVPSIQVLLPPLLS
jgi:hypothetical protein